ncbi:7-alpha-hydroxysteroid dehydrogenase [Halopolyspora algeriensis]|uniref:7-alpha-hydroxysteroid dehydrogenase n=1 Tax=Halopolyspora algeriensis TaxID=1500506 RepID=A0A368VWM9_9ACTN|nr:SDR family oxidoreductase [Halopolyspora algeriensis]RCW44567.1 7-alpha-hydroxysteroid dehydrogenase [Halopolyspora algeriensis]TQM55927.1 7-alpha-hydroxysteroid dehydrogenase [Halopolyspora algeriensis]
MSILNRFTVTDRVAVVTGSGRGLGAASALALAEAGADVVLCARTEEQLTEVADRIAATGRRAVTVPADLSKRGAAAELVTAATEQFGRLDILVNNVGGAMPGDFLGTGPEDLEKAFSFNVGTAHELTRAAVPHLLEHGCGSVIGISSGVGHVAGRGYLTYGTAKAALEHYTRLAAHDLAPRVRINAIAPGAAATSALELVTADEGMRTQVEQATPLGRIADPSEIAAAVVYLASDASSFVTGKVLEVDGGADRPTLDLGLPDL